MNYVLPSSTVSPSVGVFLALISLASITIFAFFYLHKKFKNRFWILMSAGCLGLGTSLSLFTIGASLYIADERAKATYDELDSGKMILDGSLASPSKPF